MPNVQKICIGVTAIIFLLFAFNARGFQWIDDKEPEVYNWWYPLGAGGFVMVSGYKNASYIGPAGAELTVEVEMTSRVTAKGDGKYDYHWVITNLGTGPFVQYEDSGNGPNFLQNPPLYGTAGPDRIPGTPDDVPPGSEEDERLNAGPPAKGRWGGKWNPIAGPSAQRFQPGPEITDMTVDRDNNDSVEITWTCDPFKNYSVEHSQDPYDYNEGNMYWSTVASWLYDDDADGYIVWYEYSSVPKPPWSTHWYRVWEEPSPTFSPGGPTQVGDTLGVLSLELHNGRNMVSSPLEPYPPGGIELGAIPGFSTLDQAIGNQLTGHIFNRAFSDQIEYWDFDTSTYLRAWYKTGGVNQWQDWDTPGAPPQFGWDADAGYWVTLILDHGPSFVQLCGSVSTTNRETEIKVGRNLVGSCYPVIIPLDETGLVESGFTGHMFNRAFSDNIEFYDNTTSNYERFWYKTGTTNAWQPWNPGDPMRDINPGDGFWVNVLNIGGEHQDFTWAYPKPKDDSLKIIGIFADGETLQPYSDYVTATGGMPPYSFTIHDGYLPDGLYLSQDGDNAVISGTPQYSGTYDFVLRVWDNDIPQSRFDKELSINIEGMP